MRMSLNEVEREIEKLNEKIKELESMKEEIMVRQGKAYRCRKCGKIVKITPFIKGSEEYNEKLCYSCWEEQKLKEIRKKWLKILGGAKIIDVVPEDNPYITDELYEVLLEKDGKKYRLELKCYEDECRLVVYDLTNKKYVDVSKLD